MPDLDDIHNALDLHDMPALQGAFRSLIGVPGEPSITGATSIDEVMSTFSQVCLVLEGDKTTMPGAVGGELMVAGASAGEPFVGSTYEDGAAFAMKQAAYFRGLLQIHIGEA